MKDLIGPRKGSWLQQWWELKPRAERSRTSVPTYGKCNRHILHIVRGWIILPLTKKECRHLWLKIVYCRGLSCWMNWGKCTSREGLESSISTIRLPSSTLYPPFRDRLKVWTFACYKTVSRASSDLPTLGALLLYCDSQHLLSVLSLPSYITKKHSLELHFEFCAPCTSKLPASSLHTIHILAHDLRELSMAQSLPCLVPSSLF